ncbi:hypothetical protein AVEN_119033-1 [Araneus ventricosus]|uniref:Mos1 transposase HTH domain-containing protein n=1 Tax=Araneus ventricosus TaxID=182803 RepID=A0A4Y2FEN0_ARAVE|nr:hypothetical protein AVEN_119033-1 [Araneus ventricosus]
MFKTIADPADCEVRSVIRFLNAKNVKPDEIHRQLAEIYGENVMIDGMVRKWVRQFNDGRTNVHDEIRRGRPSVVNDGLIAKEQFDHPPYSPNLAPSDYHLFLNLKRDFGDRSFDSDDNAKNGVQQWLSSLAASFFEEGIDKLVSRYDRCLNNGGTYVEK